MMKLAARVWSGMAPHGRATSHLGTLVDACFWPGPLFQLELWYLVSDQALARGVEDRHPAW
jgi:hypothetical protein